MTPSRRKAKPTGRSRVLLTIVAALAFFVQSFVTQTHIHGVPVGAAKATVIAFHDNGTDKQRDPFPAKGDPANCPLCQEIAHAGHYTAPVHALEVQPALRIAQIVPIPHTRATEFVLSHAWRSRAPPTA